MTLKNTIEELKKSFNIIDQVDLTPYYDLPIVKQLPWLKAQITAVHKPVYETNDRIIFTLSCGDIYQSLDDPAGMLISNFQQMLNAVDISNFFVILLTPNDAGLTNSINWVHTTSTDTIPITHITYGAPVTLDKSLLPTVLETKSLKNDYNSLFPIKMDVATITDRQLHLLTESKTFCMYPWIHLHAYPTGAAHLCCHAEMEEPIGDCQSQSLKEIWNGDKIKSTRLAMVSDTLVDACAKCYEAENAGFFSGRQSANKHFGHHITRVDDMKSDGTVEEFGMTYWDIRFSNLCNLSCRSCGHIFSSSWYQDQVKLAGPEWKLKNQVLNYSGRTPTDMWEQLVPHLDYVEQIYFAGGEPLMMKEHYNILDELERRGRFDVRLIYNTNFTQIKLKDRTVFDYWKRFKSVAVGASLDAMGPRAEYIRKGTVWDTVERNREQMLATCPDVDFYISPTLSIMNALHLPDFHRSWVNQGLLKPQDLNVNILQDPAYLRIDIAPAEYKTKISNKYQEHIEWLRPLDLLQRATVGFESAIKFMMATDNSKLISKFWEKTFTLDRIRKESILDIIPELDEME